MWVSCLFCVFLAWCCSFQARAFKMLENLERADKDLLCGLWTRKWVARIIGMLADIALRVEQPATDDLISANQLQSMHWTCAQLALCGKPASGRLYSYFYQRVIFSAARVTDVLVSSSIHAHMACSSMEACGSSVVYQRQSRITVNRKKREAKQTMVGDVSTRFKVTVESERRKVESPSVASLCGERLTSSGVRDN